MRSSTLFRRINRHPVKKPHVARQLTKPVREACVPPVDSIVEYGAYIGGEKVVAPGIVESLELVREHNKTGSRAFVWVGLHEPEAPEVEWLAEVFGLHPLAVEDAVKAHQRPKVERYGDSLFLVLKTIAYLDHDELTATSEIIATGEIMVFLGADFVVTVRHGEHCPLTEVREKLESRPDLLDRGPAGVVHAISDYVVDRYLQVADLMQLELEEVEATVFADVSSRDINRIYQLKREMLEMKRAVTPLQSPMAALPQRRVIPSEMREYFRDVSDHLARVCEQVESSNELANSILQAALARSNTLANEDMRKISSWVAILTVPTMIAGIYGMNFDFLPGSDQIWGYPAIVALMITVCTFLYRGFRRNGWL
ncbi:magnesium/cobalt transporter CorA [Nonomuraea endophytica]|uniref:Magnesium transport protein CorA n=1 Tax=Nonomuraea endophytica TaxID=714136 RepID=A0A7W8EDM1_9ACTN|nr:magnesium/cobalt transporter CorA [Nonomuraea endophytica]MBB5075699.1 magnesium transporter [Nonomuraea endophytica]